MQVSAASIEQSDQRGVDVPDLIGGRGPDPDLRLGRMKALPGPSPVAIADQAIPRAGRSKHFTKSLSQQSQGSGGNVSILVGCCQVMDRLNLGSRKLLGCQSGTRWLIIECTLLLAVPVMVARR